MQSIGRHGVSNWLLSNIDGCYVLTLSSLLLLCVRGDHTVWREDLKGQVLIVAGDM